MFCVKCGNTLYPGSNFCSNCGHATEPKSSPDPKTHVKLVKKMQKGYPWWVNSLIVVLFVGLIYAIYLNTYSSFPNVVEKQLEAIRSNHITEAYYHYASKEFQSRTSFVDFKKFINEHAVLKENQSFKVTKEHLHNLFASVDGVLTSRQNEKQKAQFKLVKEGDQWKILSVDLVVETTPLEAIEDHSEAHAKAVVQSQLKALSERDIFDAYYNYTSKEFQEATSFSVFQQFMERFSIFSSYQEIDFRTFIKGYPLSSFIITLNNSFGSMVVEYAIGLEGDQWKIWGIHLLERSDQDKLKNKSPKEMIQAQINAIRNHDLISAYYDFSSIDFQKTTSFRNFEKFVKEQQVMYHNRSSKLDVTSHNDNVAVVLGELVSMDDFNQELDFELVLEGDVWKTHHIKHH